MFGDLELIPPEAFIFTSIAKFGSTLGLRSGPPPRLRTTKLSCTVFH
jgi:hypothetical protein